MELLGPKCWSILISHRKLTIEEIGDQSQLFGVSVCLRSRGNGSRIRISRRRPIFTVESEPSSIARQTKANDVAVFAVRVCDPAQRVDTPFARSPGFREHLMIARGRAAFVVLGQFAGGLCGLPCP